MQSERNRIANPPEVVQGVGIVKAPVNALAIAWKYRTTPGRIVTYRHHDIELTPGELVVVLRSVPADIDPDLPHCLDCLVSNLRRFGSSALNGPFPVCEMAEKSLRHLATRTIAGTQD
jgi:hypothetical protein